MRKEGRFVLSGRQSRRGKVAVLAFVVGLVVLLAGGQTALSARQGFRTDDPPYVKPVADGVTVTPLLTVAEAVARTDSAGQYRMVGIPDGLGAYQDGNGDLRVLMNHELVGASETAPVVDGPLVTGSYQSEWVLGAGETEVASGDLAWTTIISGTVPVEGVFSRFCSSYLGDEEYGFDRPIFFAGEESSGEDTFDGQGGLGVAIFDDKAHIIPELGHFPKENVVPARGTGNKTVLFGLEDGPSSPDSQLYLYVGEKDAAASDPLAKNGLSGGRLYVWVPDDNSTNDEGDYHIDVGPLTGSWQEIEDPTVPETALEEAADNARAFGFVRIEDGTATVDAQGNGVLYFVTTGSTFGDPNFANNLGRTYKLTFDVTDPTAEVATLEILLEGDYELAQGNFDRIVVNPDNVDINDAGILMIQEDANSDHRGDFITSVLGRGDASMWAYDTNTEALTRVAEIDQTVVPEEYRDEAGGWETSGITDASAWYGEGAWLFDVQAHSIDSLGASTLQGLSTDAQVDQGGQLLLLQTGGATAVEVDALQASGGTPRLAWLLAAAGVLVMGAGLLLARRR